MNSCILAFSLLLFHIEVVICLESSIDKCLYIHHTYYKQTHDVTSKNCFPNEICKNNYRISYIHYPPYSEVLLLEERIRQCCGCMNYRITKKFENISELTTSTAASSDFILPVLGTESKPTLYGFYYISVIEAPSYVYITRKPPPLCYRMMKKLGSAFPLLIIVMLAAIIAGFVTWILKTWCEPEELPKPVFRGWLDGFWWSFVNLITLSYGEKTPRSFFSRIFALVWILIGITIFNIFTGMVTVSIIDSERPEEPSIRNMKVGVLQYRIRDSAFVAKLGGFATTSNGINFDHEVLSLISMLKEHQVDGIVFDMWTYNYIKHHWAPYINTDMDLFKDTVVATKTYPGEKHTYGILVKDFKVYEYFRDALTDNILSFETELAIQCFHERDSITTPMGFFDVRSEMFQRSVILLSAIVGVLLISAIIIRISKKRNDQVNEKDTNCSPVVDKSACNTGHWRFHNIEIELDDKE